MLLSINEISLELGIPLIFWFGFKFTMHYLTHLVTSHDTHCSGATSCKSASNPKWEHSTQIEGGAFLSSTQNDTARFNRALRYRYSFNARSGQTVNCSRGTLLSEIEHFCDYSVLIDNLVSRVHLLVYWQHS